MSKINVAVLFGGCSAEHEVSCASAATIISHMSEEKYNIIPLYITKEGKWLLYDGNIDNIKNVQWEKFGTTAILSPDRINRGLMRIVGNKIKFIPVDIVFPVIHGTNGEDGTIQGLFELAGIPYVGCGVLSSAVCMDKHFTKIICSAMDIPQADYLSYTEADLESMDEITKKIRYTLGYPCFVKPANAGSSVGISRAGNKKELEAALRLAAEYDRKIIVEKSIAGRELECAVLGSGADDTEASVVGEILPAAEFYDYDAKYNNKESKTVVPADIPDEVSDQIRIMAVRIFKALDCSGLARVDFFLENQTNPVVFNEINTMPGFTPISMYPALWREMGLETSGLIDTLIDLRLNGVAENG